MFVALRVKKNLQFLSYVYFPESESPLSVGLMSPTPLMTHTSANTKVSTIFPLICRSILIKFWLESTFLVINHNCS